MSAPNEAVRIEPASGPVPPAPFVGRDAPLALALRRWRAALDGDGHFLLIAGEAGIGKTRLLAELEGRLGVGERLRAAVFPRDSEAVGGVIVDLASALARNGVTGTASALRSRLLSSSDRAGDSSRDRRILVSDLADLLTELLRERPTLLCIEDLHWADELSLDVLERVGAAMRGTSSMVVATYRSDELYPRTPLRRLRARLVGQRLAEEVHLTRLSAEDTEILARSLLSERAAGDIVRLVVDRSEGIPLYVEELIAAGDTALPETIADAVLSHTAALNPSAASALEAAAVIGRSFDIDLVVAVEGSPRRELDAALRELGDRNLILASVDGASFDFRHALIRDAVYGAISPLRKRDLHSAAADAAVRFGLPDAFVSDQYERAQQPALAHRHALKAAAAARRVSSNREAVGLLRRAQRTMPGDSSELSRAALHAELGEVLAASDDNASAAEQFTTAIEIFRNAGDEVSAARLVPQLAAARHLLGEDVDRRVVLITDELNRLNGTTHAVPVDVRAGLLSGLASAYMLDRHLDPAFEAGSAAAELAAQGESTAAQLDIDITIGAVEVFAGRMVAGWERLERAASRAVSLRLEATAARGYRMIGSSASMLVDYPRATQWIDEGIEYARGAERWNDLHYLQAHSAHVLWATGQWDEARALAESTIADEQGGITTRHTALLVLGYLAMGAGDSGMARRYLEEARQIGECMVELQRLAPALWGLAETALIDGEPATAVELLEYAIEKSARVGDAAYSYPTLATGVRAYAALHDPASARDWFERGRNLIDLRSIPGTMPSISHAKGILLLAEGRPGEARPLLERAVADWDALGRFWDASRACIDLAHCAARSRRPRDAAQLVGELEDRARDAGATALLDLARQVPLDGQSPGPLSARELEVARLVAKGATNRQIAEVLVISPKTASAHIEHILAKLGATRRTQIASWISSQSS